jgi:putative NADH-flavin reductase
MHILVIGASGTVGRSLIEEGLKRGHSFTAQTRTPGKLAETDGVRVVVGNPVEQTFVDTIVPGHDASYSSSASITGGPRHSSRTQRECSSAQ